MVSGQLYCLICSRNQQVIWANQKQNTRCFHIAKNRPDAYYGEMLKTFCFLLALTTAAYAHDLVKDEAQNLESGESVLGIRKGKRPAELSCALA